MTRQGPFAGQSVSAEIVHPTDAGSAIQSTGSEAIDAAGPKATKVAAGPEAAGSHPAVTAGPETTSAHPAVTAGAEPAAHPAKATAVEPAAAVKAAAAAGQARSRRANEQRKDGHECRRCLEHCKLPTQSSEFVSGCPSPAPGSYCEMRSTLTCAVSGSSSSLRLRSTLCHVNALSFAFVR